MPQQTEVFICHHELYLVQHENNEKSHWEGSESLYNKIKCLTMLTCIYSENNEIHRPVARAWPPGTKLKSE